VGLDGVLERAAVDLDRVRDAGPRERAGEDQRAHHEVVRERHVRASPRHDLRDRGDVALHVVGDLRVAQLRVGARDHAVVAVGDVHRQQPAEIGPVGERARRVAAHVQLQRTAVPVTRGVDPRELERRPVLAEQVDLVPRTGERLAERRVVHVGAGPAQQVAVEDQDAHAGEPSGHPAGRRRSRC
jgi:hypothetical protein